MATIWSNSATGFMPHTVEGSESQADVSPQAGTAAKKFRLVAVPGRSRSSYALLVAADSPLQVNGAAVVGGIHVLQHKDEILIGGERMYFSAESTPIVQPYRHAEDSRRPRCAVCRNEIQDGQDSVRCPGCGRVYHQIREADGEPGRPCWTYAATCKFCDHPTSLSGEPSWRPECEAGCV